MDITHELIEAMTSNMYQYPVERAPAYSVDAITALTSQVEVLSNKIGGLQFQNSAMCDFCGGEHPNYECQTSNMFVVHSMPEQSDFVNNFCRHDDPYNNMYNSGWRNHSNYSLNNYQERQQPLEF